ncbi:MAG: hypothetical protein PHV74_09135 [Dehalococcoidia bacterium]|nr:hypothetical protein [Dehalococcoidia bacterium]
MRDFDLVKHHLQSSILAARAEIQGNEEKARQLRAQGNLRLMVMSEVELRELAIILSCLPSRPPDAVYAEIKKEIDEHKETAADWIGAFGVEPYPSVSRKKHKDRAKAHQNRKALAPARAFHL